MTYLNVINVCHGLILNRHLGGDIGRDPVRHTERLDFEITHLRVSILSFDH